MMTLARLLAFVILAGAAPLAAPPAQAQTATTEATDLAPDYVAWEAVAKRAEDAVQAARASTPALEDLRAELVGWRAKFLAAQSINQTRIKTLKDQIATLGPVPADGTSEPDEIASRRVALNDQLAKLQAPVLSAEEAYSRADGVIREIDTLIRERQADQLLQLGPSPLNPANWTTSLLAATNTLRAIGDEIISNWNKPAARATLRDKLPVILLLLALAAVLLARGRKWMEMLTIQVSRSGNSRSRAVYSSLISLGQVLLPALGVIALAAAISESGMVGAHAAVLVKVLPVAVSIFFFARWLGGRVFPRADTHEPLFHLTPERNAEGRFLASAMGLAAALGAVVGRVATTEGFATAARVTWGFPFLLIAGFLIFSMGRLLIRHVRAEAETKETRPYRNRIVTLIARAAMVLAVVGPLLGAIGYFQAAIFFTYPTIGSLAMFALLAVLQRFVVDVYVLITGNVDTASDALVPVLVGFALSLLALPVLALIWGARVADLTELWSRFTAGFQLGGTRISPTDFLIFVVVFAVGYTLTRLVQGALRTSVLPKTKIDVGGQNAIVSGIGYLGIFLAAIIAITTAGIDLSSLAIVAGALSVGIGFGLQNIVSNFVSGIILLIERPVSEGDWIEVGGVMGTVRDISVRSTRVETFDRTDVIVPNSDLITSMVTNWTRSNLTGRIILSVGVAYGTDTRKVQALLEEIAQAHPIVIINPPPLVIFKGFGADSLDFEVRAILRDVNFGLRVRSELNHEIARRFAEEDIEIPFAQRDIWLRNPEALRGAEAPPAPTPAPARVTPTRDTATPPQPDDPDGDR